MTIKRVEQYLIFDVIAAGGMASVHLGLAQGALGFSRLVAVKRLHPQFAANPQVVAMLVDEARLTSRIRHVNVVSTLDVIESDNEVFIIMEYVRGAPLDVLVRAQHRSGNRVPMAIGVAILSGALRGLHAAHESVDWSGQALELVHRDFSPQNILVGVGGIPRVIDFGVAKAMGRSEDTGSGQFRGKPAYASPEVLRGGPVSRQTDLFAAGTILWELLTGERLFRAETHADTFHNVLNQSIPNPLEILRARGGQLPDGMGDDGAALAAVVMQALDYSPERRPSSALEMATAMEAACPPARTTQVARWVDRLAAERLVGERTVIARIESYVSSLPSGRALLASDIANEAPADSDPSDGPDSGRTTAEKPDSFGASEARPSNPKAQEAAPPSARGAAGAAPASAGGDAPRGGTDKVAPHVLGLPAAGAEHPTAITSAHTGRFGLLALALVALAAALGAGLAVALAMRGGR